MDPYVYEGLVGRLEAESEKHPALFRSKVMLISGSAYIVLAIALITIAVLIYLGFDWAGNGDGLRLFVVGTFAFSMLPVYFVVLRMFFMRLQPPQGTPLTREQAPKLFEVLDKMRRKLKAPPIHHVLIDDQFNAAVAQLPRWGLFGGHTNYLMLGLPYLLGTPANEMLATVAHEYGHLSGNHGKFGAWVYRQRRTFGALYEQVTEARDDSAAHWFLATALDWFMPYYNAYTFVLSRQDEYEADRIATQLVGAEANAGGLIRDELLGRWIREDFWPTIFRQVNSHMRPAIFPYASMRIAFKAGYTEWATPERLSDAWRVQSGLHDTHPALRDRVEATGQPSALPSPVQVTAAEALLGTVTARQLIEEFDQSWWKQERQEWETRHRYVVRSKQRLQELSPQSLEALALHDLQELAKLKSEFESAQDAKVVLEHLLRRPGGPFPKAAYLYGRILVDEKDERGLEHLATAAANDVSLIESAANAGYFYLLEKRGEAAAQAWWERVTERKAA